MINYTTSRTSNPVFAREIFVSHGAASSIGMRIGWTVAKTMLLLGIVSLSAIGVWGMFVAGQFEHVRFLLSVSVPISFVLGLITSFNPRWSFVTAPLYAFSQGVLVGSFSAIAEVLYPGVVTQAVPLTSFILFGMLLLYSTGLIRVTNRLRTMIFASIFALLCTYLLEFVLRFLGVEIPYIHESGLLGIFFSGFVVVLAAFSLLLDFEFIVQSQAAGFPRYMEWYCAYGLMVSLIWLYLRVLKLLVKTSKERRS